MTLMNIFLIVIITASCHSFILRHNRNTFLLSGKSQSPIFVDLSRANYVSYPPFVFSNDYHQTTTFHLSDRNKETILIRPSYQESRILKVTGGCLPGEFTFQSAHLHWPKSEHEFKGQEYVAEAHFIHKNLDTNVTAVFAYFFTLDDTQSDEKDAKISDWDFIIQRFTNNFNITISGGLESLMQGNKNRFVHYKGSLTTEPFSEGILWILISSNMELSGASFNLLQKNIVASNYRLIQDLNNRYVHRSFISAKWST